MKNIAIILARGGSKRLPRKNILDFYGKPMLVWTILAALESGKFDRVLVSTDDQEIAQVASANGAQVPFLRNAAYDDMAPSSEATILALHQAEAYWSETYDVVAQLMPNCPMRDKYDIRSAVENFIDHNHISQISCFRYGWMNPWWAAKINDAGYPEYMFPESRSMRSQDLSSLYCPSGAIWIAHAEALKTANSFYMPEHILHPMSWISAMDIDDENDLQMARACFIIKNKIDVS